MKAPRASPQRPISQYGAFNTEATDVYVGRYVNVLVRAGVGLRFRERRVVLDLETLRPHGKLSFIL